MTVTILFTNATTSTTHTKDFVVSDPSQVPAIALNQAKQYDVIDAAKTAPPTGAIAYPAAPTGPTTADPAVVQFRNDMAKLRSLQAAVTLGIMAPGNATLTAHIATVQTQLNANPSFIAWV